MRWRPKLLKTSQIESMSEREILEEIFIDKTSIGIYYGLGGFFALEIIVALFTGSKNYEGMIGVGVVVFSLAYGAILWYRQASRLQQRLPAFKTE